MKKNDILGFVIGCYTVVTGLLLIIFEAPIPLFILYVNFLVLLIFLSLLKLNQNSEEIFFMFKNETNKNIKELKLELTKLKSKYDK